MGNFATTANDKMPVKHFWATFQDLDNYPPEEEGCAGFRGFGVRLVGDRVVVVYSNHYALPPAGDWFDLLSDFEHDDPEELAAQMMDAGFTGFERPPTDIVEDLREALVEWIVEYRGVVAARSFET